MEIQGDMARLRSAEEVVGRDEDGDGLVRARAKVRVRARARVGVRVRARVGVRVRVRVRVSRPGRASWPRRCAPG